MQSIISKYTGFGMINFDAFGFSQAKVFKIQNMREIIAAVNEASRSRAVRNSCD